MSFRENETYIKLQRPFRIRKSLRGLVKPTVSKSQVKLPPLPPHDPQIDEYVYDILYECQRGSLSVGYSSKTLLQFDPNPWCDADMKFTPMNTANYQLPDPTWQWVSKDWMIDMTEDVDEVGWQYSLKFHGADWHGNYKHFRSFVRRRRWIRLRHRSKKTNRSRPTLQPSSAQPSSTDVLTQQQDFLTQLRYCRLDREKMKVLNQAIEAGHIDQIKDKMSEYINLLDFEDTKYAFLCLLIEHNVQLSEENKKEIQSSLHFYSHLEELLLILEKKNKK
ncbi:hypothetical protein BY458DRAFT_584984 [Sporodiniella umbellata]|nr:hypothetical protein BY458DRAFT_584984 [Sporodiniella umbellata]